MNGHITNIVLALVAGAIATVSALPMFDVGNVPEWVLAADFPGIVMSIMVAQELHAFSPWVMAIASWLFYSLLFLMIRRLMGPLRAG